MYTYLAASSQKVTGNVLVIFFVIGFRSFISNTVKLGPILIAVMCKSLCSGCSHC